MINMYKDVLIIVTTILSLFLFGNEAMCDEYHFEQSTSKHLETLFKQLDAIGIDDPDVRDFITKVDQRSHKNGEVDLIEQSAPEGSIKFRYVTHVDNDPSAIKQRRFQLVYTPQFVDHTELVAARGCIALKFHINLE